MRHTEEQDLWEDGGLVAAFTRSRILSVSTFRCDALLQNCLHRKNFLAMKQYCGGSDITDSGTKPGKN